jgi:acyl-CoA hydrolase/GNAT superfamily N-acetyltransferase
VTTNAEEALACIRPGTKVFIGSGCGEPRHLVEQLAARAPRLYDVEAVQVLSVQPPQHEPPSLGDSIKLKHFFLVGHGARQAVYQGRAEYVPVFMSDVPKLLAQDKPDYVLIQASPPDNHGYLSLGVAVDVTKEAIEAAETVIVQINPAMPRTLGDSFIHLSEVDYLVEHDEALPELAEPRLDEIDLTIGQNIARLIDDGSTIHAGLGRVPAAVLKCLDDKKDLGVHTDMFTVGYLRLIESGVITNRRKELNRNRCVAAYALGDRELFDFMNMNPFVEFHPCAYTNSPSIIGTHERMVSIHEAMETDLTGLVCTSSRGHRVYTGVGGLVDFMRGVARSKYGKFIIALHSISEDGQESNVVPRNAAGSGLMASRSAIQHVVTEFGSVNLHGKSLGDRAIALIQIAHPRFREQLKNQAQDLGLLGAGEPISLFAPVLYPQELERTEQLGEISILFRPSKATDLRAIQEFFYGLNDKDVYFRFLRTMRAFPREEMAAMANIDYQERMTILGLVGELGFETVVAIGRYVAVAGSELVEVDIAVDEEFRRHGVGEFLLRYVFDIARDKGFQGILAHIAYDNPQIIKLVQKMGYRVKATLDCGVYEIEIRFDDEVDQPTFELTYPGPWQEKDQPPQEERF